MCVIARWCGFQFVSPGSVRITEEYGCPTAMRRALYNSIELLYRAVRVVVVDVRYHCLSTPPREGEFCKYRPNKIDFSGLMVHQITAGRTFLAKIPPTFTS